MTKKKHRGTDRLYKVGEVESALCVWEWVLDSKGIAQQRLQIEELGDNYGWSSLRSTAIQVAIFVDECWRWADKNASYLTDSSSFDWDFCPLICSLIDWGHYANDNQYGNASWHPNVDEFMATVIAAKALKVA